MIKYVRPPTRRDLGNRIKKLKPVLTTPEVLQEQLDVAKGLPPSLHRTRRRASSGRSPAAR